MIANARMREWDDATIESNRIDDGRRARETARRGMGRSDEDEDSEDERGESSALGVLGGPALDASLGGLGAMDASRVGRHVGRRGTTTTTTTTTETGDGKREGEGEGRAIEVNPFEVDERELEARASEPMGVGMEETETETETAGNGDDVSNVAMRTPGGGVLENGSYHAGDGMTYGDLLAPPPSYADSVMYTQPEIQPSADAATNDGGGGIGAATTMTVFLDENEQGGDEGMLKVSVSDPKIEADTTSALVGKRVTHYKITTRTNIASYIHKEVVVWRRFRDFVALDTRLNALHRGYFIPPRPEKTVVNSTGDSFIQERTVQLQQYLNRIATHPKLRLGDALRIFLTHQDLGASLDWFNMASGVPAATLGATPSSPETPQRPPLTVSSPGQSRDFGRFFKELRQTVVQSTAVTTVGDALGLDTPKPKVMEEDAAFLVEKDRVHRIEHELSGMSSKATKLLTLQQKYGEAVGEFGMECLKFAKLQEEEGTRLGKYSENGIDCMTAANEMRKAGNTSVRVSRLARSATSQTAQALNPLHDYLKLMPSVRRSIGERNESLLTLQTMLAETDSLEARIAKLTPDFTKMKKVEDLKLELDATRATGERAREDYNTIQERHREEFSRLEKERVGQFHSMLLNYARVQVANAERSLSLWRGLAEEFGASADEWRTPKPERADVVDL